MAKIILINPYPYYATGINNVATLSPPLGLAYLAAVLEKNNHKVQVIDASILGVKSRDIAAYFKFKPELIGISSNIVTYKEACEYLKELKPLYKEIPFVFGGTYSSSLARTILEKNPLLDSIVIGEGENTLLEIVESLGKKNIFEEIKGVIYRFKGQIIHNEPRPLIENLDDIPFPAYHILHDLRKYKTRSRASPVGYVITSRGCSFRCTFCNRNIFGDFWRPHSVSRVIDEISFLVERYGVRQIDILDDNFTFDINRTHEILDCLINRHPRMNINLQNGVRISGVNKELLKKMKNAGVFKIGFGIETADKRIQKRINKPIDLDKAATVIGIARSLGMVTCGFFMMGLPGDNAETMEKTIDFALKANPHFAHFPICIPFPGTNLFEEIKERGEFLKNVEDGIDAGFFGEKVFFRLDSMDSKEVILYFRKAYKKFYMRPSKIIDILSTMKSVREFQWLTRIIGECLEHM